VNQIYDGIVTKVESFGCFVQLQNVKGGRGEGLVHISEIKDQKVKNAFSVVKRNQPVKVKVLSAVSNRISLSIKDVNQQTGEEILRSYKLEFPTN